MLSRRHPLCFLVLIGAFLVGCSNASKSPAPTAPTAASSASSAAIDLTAVTPLGKQGAGTTAPVVGTVGQLAGACPNLTFVLSGVTIRVTGATKFEGGTCADIQNDVRAGAIGAKNADGSIDAARVKVAPPPPPPPPHAEGLVTSLSGACPALTFVLSGTTVHTTDKTLFEGGTCADVKEGGRAGAVGPKDASGVLNAERVKLPPPPPPHAEGLVTSLSGACPALTFVLSGTTVHTTDKTVFEGGTCADVKEGGRAGAVGPKDASGVLNAERVKLPPPPPPHAEGPIAALSGTCPALTFTLSGTTVHTSDKTVFEGGTCTDVKEGARAGAVGPKDAAGAINAERVKIAPPPLPRVSGTVSSASGSLSNRDVRRDQPRDDGRRGNHHDGARQRQDAVRRRRLR